MSRNQTIQYFIDPDTGYMGSRVGDQMAFEVIEFEKIGQDGDFSKPLTTYLEKFPVSSCYHNFGRLIWTRKLPLAARNYHREFWGMKPVKASLKYCPNCDDHIKKCAC